MDRLTFIPVGGLANRMRATASAILLAENFNCNLKIIWFRDWALNCYFKELFKPFNFPSVILKEASITDLFFYDRPRKKNIWFPYLFQFLYFNKRLYEKEMCSLLLKQFSFNKLTPNKNVYIASFSPFYKENKSFFSKLFIPSEELLKQIEENMHQFTSQTIGIHIRRTDNLRSITESPTILFIAQIEKEIELNREVNFYLATDDENEKRIICQKYGEKIITLDREVSRNSTEGIKHAVIELFLLSRTSRIYGSYGSSFSEMASWIGDIPLQLIKSKK